MSYTDFLRHEGVLSNTQYSVRTMVEEIDYENVTRLIGGNRSAKFNDSFVTFSILSNLIQDLENNLVESPIVFVDRVEQAAILSQPLTNSCQSTILHLLRLEPQNSSSRNTPTIP